MEDRSGASARDGLLVLVGADTVYEDGSIKNRIGTRPLAEAAWRTGVRTVVACEILKLAPVPPPAVEDQPELRDTTAAEVIDEIVAEEGPVIPVRCRRSWTARLFLRDGYRLLKSSRGHHLLLPGCRCSGRDGPRCRPGPAGGHPADGSRRLPIKAARGPCFSPRGSQTAPRVSGAQRIDRSEAQSPSLFIATRRNRSSAATAIGSPPTSIVWPRDRSRDGSRDRSADCALAGKGSPKASLANGDVVGGPADPDGARTRPEAGQMCRTRSPRARATQSEPAASATAVGWRATHAVATVRFFFPSSISRDGAVACVHDPDGVGVDRDHRRTGCPPRCGRAPRGRRDRSASRRPAGHRPQTA